MDKKIVMIIAPAQFRDEELFVPKEIFEADGYTVVVAGQRVKPARGMLGGQAQVQCTIKDIRVDDYSAIILVGGGGADVFWNDISLHTLLKEAYNKRRVIGAECIAPVTLANAGLLDGKKATVWHTESTQLQKRGVEYTAAAVTVAGYIVTSNGPQSAQAFAEAILKTIVSLSK